MSRLGAWRRALALAGVVVVVDQVSKQVAVSELLGRAPVELPLGFELDYVTNTGIAFGLLGDGAGLITAVAVITVCGLLAWLAATPDRPGLWLATGLLLGGALGNLADRVRSDAVVDFVDPPWWPAFNVADVAITAGVVVLIAGYLRPQAA